MRYYYNELSEKDRERLHVDSQRRSKLKMYKIHCDLDKMISYGQKLKKTSDKKDLGKGSLLIEHAIYLKNLLNTHYENGTFKNNLQKNFIAELNKHNALFNKHREVKQIVAAIATNIALFFLSGGIFYALAVGARFATNSSGFFFTRTKSRNLIAKVEERVNYYQAPSYFISEKELAQREINSKVVHELYERELRERQLGLFGTLYSFP